VCGVSRTHGSEGAGTRRRVPATRLVPAEVRPLAETGAVIGVDWGVKETATTTSDAHDLPHAEHGKKAQAKLSRYDRMMARRKPAKGQAASKGYREAKHLRAKAHLTIPS